MSKEEKIKKVLLDLIYNVENKPRFVGGKIKLDLIDEAVPKILELSKQSKYDVASMFLSCDGGEDEIIKMVNAIERHSDNDDSTPIDHLNDVQVAEAFEYAFTCGEFLNLINS